MAVFILPASAKNTIEIRQMEVSMVNFRGKEYFDERQVVEVLLEENEQLKAKIAEQERILDAFNTVVNFIKKEGTLII